MYAAVFFQISTKVVMKTQFASLLLLFCCLPLSSCSHFANKPMKILQYQYDQTAPSKNLFVFMRGLGGNNRSFADAGMVDEVKNRGIPFDIVAPNAHFAYYAKRTLIDRLHEDVILPATRQGYTNIWLVGVSMGGLGSLLYLKERPEHIDGIFLIAPFLGYDDILDEIIAAGGVQQWQPGVYDPDDQWERMLWHWIKDRVDGEKTIPILHSYGRSDKYVKGQDLFATVISENRVIRSEGGHDVKTIALLWKLFLERGLYKTVR